MACRLGILREPPSNHCEPSRNPPSLSTGLKTRKTKKMSLASSFRLLPADASQAQQTREAEQARASHPSGRLHVRYPTVKKKMQQRPKERRARCTLPGSPKGVRAGGGPQPELRPKPWAGRRGLRQRRGVTYTVHQDMYMNWLCEPLSVNLKALLSGGNGTFIRPRWKFSGVPSRGAPRTTLPMVHADVD